MTPGYPRQESATLILLLLGATACIIPRMPGATERSFAVSRARSACVDEAKRVGLDDVEVLSDSEGGGTSAVGETILVRLRFHQGNKPDETTCLYDTRSARADISR